MARTYLMAGLIVQPFMRAGPAVAALSSSLDAKYYIELGWKLPRNYPLLRFPSRHTSLSVCFWNVGHGLLAIRAPNRRRAYELSNTLWGYVSLAFGFEPDLEGGQYVLHELSRMPDPSWTDQQLVVALGALDPGTGDSALYALSSGPALDHRHVVSIRDRLPALLEIPALHDAPAHFRTSRQLFHGYMVGSYYHFHYSRERRQLHWGRLEKLYFEHRARFELAFLASFKAIERLLGRSHFRAHEITGLIEAAGYLGVTPRTTYTWYHEVFRGLHKRIAVEDILRHFLRLRNGVAAHANASPPRDLMLSEDNVYEVQHFVGFLVGSAINQVTKLPNVKSFEPIMTGQAT